MAPITCAVISAFSMIDVVFVTMLFVLAAFISNAAHLHGDLRRSWLQMEQLERRAHKGHKIFGVPQNASWFNRWKEIKIWFAQDVYCIKITIVMFELPQYWLVYSFLMTKNDWWSVDTVTLLTHSLMKRIMSLLIFTPFFSFFFCWFAFFSGCCLCKILFCSTGTSEEVRLRTEQRSKGNKGNTIFSVLQNAYLYICKMDFGEGKQRFA